MNDIYVTAEYQNPPIKYIPNNQLLEKEMTVDKIEKALGHPVKIVGED